MKYTVCSFDEKANLLLMKTIEAESKEKVIKIIAKNLDYKVLIFDRLKYTSLTVVEIDKITFCITESITEKIINDAVDVKIEYSEFFEVDLYNAGGFWKNTAFPDKREAIAFMKQNEPANAFKVILAKATYKSCFTPEGTAEEPLMQETVIVVGFVPVK